VIGIDREAPRYLWLPSQVLSITPAKRRRMLNAAAYLAGFGDQPPPARIHVIFVAFDRAGRLLSIEHIENAVEAE
jgi:Holliday junction resolvase-like predicted endonuclease